MISPKADFAALCAGLAAMTDERREASIRRLDNQINFLKRLRHELSRKSKVPPPLNGFHWALYEIVDAPQEDFFCSDTENARR
jgi:hypothetical protein